MSGSPWGGSEELWSALARSALEANHKVGLFLDRDAIPTEKVGPLQKLGMDLNFPNLGRCFANRVGRRVSWKLGNLVAVGFPAFAGIHEFAPDILLISMGDAIPEQWFLHELKRARVLKYPYVLVVHSAQLFSPPMEEAERRELAGFYQSARGVFFVAERTRNDTEHLLATRLPDARIARNPVNMSDMSPVAMPSGSPVRIASVGKLATHHKGQDILLTVLGSPQFRERDWRLSIYGEGPHLQYLQTLAAHYGIAERVAFRGHQGVRAIWAENHILALPSRVESAPLALVEAMVCGRPCVVNDVGGVREWVSEPETGFISDSLHFESFGAALERAWRALPDWADIGLRARSKALQRFDPDPGSTLLKALLELDSKPGAPP